MKIWLRTLNALSEPMEIVTTAVEAVFYHVYEAMKALGLPVFLDKPKEQCVELWHGWDFQPGNGNVNVAMTTGIDGITNWKRWREADLFFLSSEFFRKRNSDCSKPMHIWYHRGVDPDIFRVLDRPNEPFVFTHAVLPREHKGTGLLCEAFKQAFAGIDDAFLHIRHPANVVEDTFSVFVEKHGGSRIKFIPQNYTSRKEAWRLYTGNCYVYPSMLDANANTVIEALCTGMPSIVSDTPLFRELLDDRCVWWLEMTDDPPNHGFGRPLVEDIGRKMLYAYEHRDELKAKGNYGAAFARARYTWTGCIIRQFMPVMREYGYLE